MYNAKANTKNKKRKEHWFLNLNHNGRHFDRPLPHHPPPIVSKGAAKGAYPPPISFENIPSHFSPRQSHPLKETEDGREKADQLQGG